MSKLTKYEKIQDMLYLLKNYGFEMEEKKIDELWGTIKSQHEKIENHIERSLIV